MEVNPIVILSFTEFKEVLTNLWRLEAVEFKLQRSFVCDNYNLRNILSAFD